MTSSASEGKRQCFACESRVTPDAAHVIQVHDSATELLIQKKLIEFDLRRSENGVSLCPSCHRMFDRDIDPGFIFFPTDIDFFIRRELQYREKVLSAGCLIPDRVPSAEEYARSQIQAGTVPPGSQCGLYQRIFLEEYMTPVIPLPVNQVFSQPVPWHGAPFGTFRRAFQALGSPRVAAISPTVRNQLSRLRDLYYSDTLVVEDVLVNAEADRFWHEPRPNQGPEPETEGPILRNISRETSQKDDQSLENHYRMAGFFDDEAKITHKCYEWVLGPESTSEDAMRRYGPAIQLSASAPTVS
ncbi:hypothetical protein AWENTII_000671 [Aspergillus wentii]